MFFTDSKSSVYHILANSREGTAPAPCGMKLPKYDLIMLQRGTPTPQVVKDRPPGTPLCKHCEKSQGGGF